MVVINILGAFMSKKNKKTIIDTQDGIIDDIIELQEKGKKHAKGFYNDFKKFITKGNIIDLAVALVIGTAFNNIVKGLVTNILTPCISVLTKGINMPDWKYILKPAILDESGVVKEAEIAILYGEWLHTIIDFIITAFFIFIALRIIMKAKNKLNEKEIANQKAEDAKKKAEEKHKAEELAAHEKIKDELFQECVTDIGKQGETLRDIRDLLKQNQQKHR